MTKFIVYRNFYEEGGHLEEFDTLEEAVAFTSTLLEGDTKRIFEVVREIEVKP